MSPAPSPIIGHAQQLAALRRDLETGNITHAYLFSGALHLGKMTIARWYAAELLRRGGEETAHDALSRVTHLLHPDLLVLDALWMEDRNDDFSVIARSSNVPQEHRKKAKAKTDTIGIDDIRAIQSRLQETGLGLYRCCIIRSVERMQAEAVNALLKLLEEPPKGVVFLLTTQAESSLLPTLISRTRVLPFSPVPRKILLPLVAKRDPEEAEFLLRMAQGAPGELMSLLADPERLRSEQAAGTVARGVLGAMSLHDRLVQLRPLSERGPEADRLLLHLALALRASLTRERSKIETALSELVEGLETNVSRELLVQRFVLALEVS